MFDSMNCRLLAGFVLEVKMVEKVKIGLWDYFVYLMTGTTVLLLTIMHCFLKGKVSWEQVLKVPGAALVAMLILALLLVGMLIEPIANLLYKLCTTSFKKWGEQLGLKKWREQIAAIETETKVYVPESIHDSTFVFAKNWVVTHGDYSEFQAFLSKYGFYRSISLVFIVNAVVTLPIHWQWWGIGGVALNVILAALYGYRAKIFYHHQSVCVYNQFILGQRSKESAEEDPNADAKDA